MRFLFVSVLLLMGIPMWLGAYNVDNIPNPHTTNIQNFVSNPDGILRPETVAQLNEILQSLETETGAEVAVVVVNTIGDADIKQFAIELEEKWKVGKAKLDNGMIVLLVVDQRKVTFETGYGLEGILPDAICKRIQTTQMLPEFRNGDYDAGVLAGVQQISSYIKKEPMAELEKESTGWGVLIPYALGFYLFLIVITIVWVEYCASNINKSDLYKTNIQRYKAMKNNKTGLKGLLILLLPLLLSFIIFYFFPMIFLVLLIPVPFMVIPASMLASKKMKAMRSRPIKCSECAHEMHLLTEKEEDAYLSVARQLEEKLHSVDYDVFLCDHCKNQAVFPLDIPSAYTACPKCGTKAYHQTGTSTLIAATYVSGGVDRTNYQCEYCKFKDHADHRTPRIQQTTTPVVSSGGGGFSSGSGGSFGGGRSGGGGATSGW